MSFHETACDIHLDHERGKRRTSLVAICNNEEGSGLTSDILLDDFLGNDNGEYVSAHCPLDEHIFNINGELLFKPDEARE
ncbi:hypothetical protein APSETT444_008792 [Aspergillus pseudonomiae]